MKLSLTATYWRAKWCSILLVFFATFISAQTTLVNYQFSGNLNPDAGALGSPVLEYKNAANTVITAQYQSNQLRAVTSSDYLELSINATGTANLAVSFDGSLTSGLGYGNWEVFANTGAGNTFVSVASLDLISVLNILSTDTFSQGLPVASYGKPDLKLRIVSNFAGLGTTTLRIDNLKLVHGTPRCAVFTHTNVAIPTGSEAGESINTVFASAETNTVGELKTYRVRNWNGTAGTNLTIDSIAILPSAGTTKNDFVIAGTNNLTNVESATVFRYCTGIEAGETCFLGSWITTEFGTFSIRFSPKGEGVRKALVRVYSNGVPSPYEFYVIGGGRSCSSTSKDYVTNSTLLSTPTLPSNLTTGDLVGGNTNAPNPTIFAKLYPLGSAPNYNPLYTTSPFSWYVKDTEKTMTYGGDDGIDLSNLRNVTIEFNVAAFGSVNTSTVTNSGYGVTNYDYIILSIEDGTGNWKDVMRLNGSNSATDKRRYIFNATGRQLTKTYARPATLTTGNNTGNNTASGGNAYSRFQLTLPLSVSSELTNFRFRIIAKANAAAAWLIDDVHIKSDAADFTIYNGSTWSNGELGITKKVIFDAPYTFTESKTICACEITENGSVTLNSGINLTVKGLINNKADANHFLIADGANLIQQEDGAINTGSAKVEKYVADVQNSLQTGQHMDYIYWSSPVSGQNLQNFSPNTPRNRFYQYHEPTDYFHVAPENEFITAKGYAIRAESGLPYGYNKTYAFSGVPNNGYITIGIQRSPDQGLVQHGYNLIGNPYPSNINFDSFYALNSSKIWKTAWFWVNDSNVYYQTGSGYEGNGYSVYNGTGGNDGVTDNNPHNAITTSQFIKSGQGFIVQKKNNGNATLNYENSIRVSNVAPFYHKTENPKNRFWLKLISPQNTVNTTLIGYIEGATNGFEQDFDAETFGLSSDLLFSKMEDYRLLIQGRNAIFTNEDRVKLGANFFQTGQYQLALMKAEGIFENSQHVYLKDHLLNTVTDLSVEPYVFDATAGLSEGRFEIVYLSEALLASQEMAKPEILIYRDGENFVAKTSGEIISLLEVYDVAGRMIYRSSPARSEATISGSRLSQGIYFVRIVLENGQVVSKKIRK